MNTDDMQFDQLVDGELTDRGRRELIGSLDTREDGWRQCALAFLEAQTWGRELKQLVREPGDANTVLAKPTSRASSSMRLATWLAVAASLGLAFTLGRAMQSPPVDDSTPQLAVVEPEAANPPQQLPTADEQDVLKLWVRDATGQPASVNVPLVNATELDRQLGTRFRSGIPDSVRRELENYGYRVQTERRYAPLWLDQGGPLVVPVEDTQITPVNRHVW